MRQSIWKTRLLVIKQRVRSRTHKSYIPVAWIYNAWHIQYPTIIVTLFYYCEQKRKFTYKVTLSRVLLTIVSMELLQSFPLYCCSRTCSYQQYKSVAMVTTMGSHTWERPTRCTLFINNLFHLNYPRHLILVIPMCLS